MDSLQEQIRTLQQQVQALQGVVEQLPAQVTAALAVAPPAKVTAPALAASGGATDTEGMLLDEGFNGERSARSGVGHSMAPEAQVQRLTAQLTAAYNRIAALEEQLLSQRLHH